MFNSDIQELQFKVVLLGSSGVGKTSLMNRIIYNTFNDKIISTTNASFASKKINFKNFNKSIILNIWDTAGQEKYKSLNQLYYKDADCILLIYDVNENNTFYEIKEYYQIVKNNVNVNKILMCIVGTKLDLYDNNNNNNNDENNNNKNIENEIKNFADKINVKICKKTSSLLNIGIEDLFNEIAFNLYFNNKQKKEQDRNSLKISVFEFPKEEKKFCCYN
jgi:small GTP-binding protein